MKNDMTFFTSKEFEDKFRYNGDDLGVLCTKTKTVFKVWSPFAERSQKKRVYGSKNIQKAYMGCIMIFLYGAKERQYGLQTPMPLAVAAMGIGAWLWI